MKTIIAISGLAKIGIDSERRTRRSLRSLLLVLPAIVVLLACASGAIGAVSAQGEESSLSRSIPSKSSSEAPAAAGDEYWDDRFGVLGTNRTVSELEVSGSNVYAGGVFTTAGGVSANNVARWDGIQWHPLGSGVSGNQNLNVYAIAVGGSNVYVGGTFNMAGGVSANNIARWDGSQWHPLGSGVNGSVFDVAVSGSDVYVVGDFTTVGQVSANRVARWDGSQWHPLGSGVGSYDYSRALAIALSGSNVYVGGDFTMAGGASAKGIARWDGSQWHPLGSGVTGSTYPGVYDIAVSGGNVYVGGNFSQAGTTTINRVARWDGSQWHPLGSGVSGGAFLPTVFALQVSGSNVYVGGSFSRADTTTINNVARWDGSQWHPLGSGVNGSAFDVAVNATDVYVGGSFTMAGGKPSNNFGIYHDLQGVGGPTATAQATATAAATAPPSGCGIEFSDVPPGSTFHPFVRCLACRDILGGYPDGTFRPQNLITRGQIAKIVSNAAGYTDDVSGKQTYADVPSTQPFHVWIERLSMRGHMGGYACGGAGETCDGQSRPYFRPGNNATRGQLSKIVSNAAEIEDTPTGQTFEDVPPSSPFYLHIERLTGRGVMSGYPCGGAGESCGGGNRPYFRPGDNVTRGQASKIVANTFFPNCQTARP
ncbi:MAG: S-layer homology domain-containing protein [Chloroflexota bacterium]|nr:S-layer homology domain-containing protein [Chloroflexota bacterium]MDQ5865179.1 S-layer homology domain-containing protein [Chloroflexota bacterium]